MLRLIWVQKFLFKSLTYNHSDIQNIQEPPLVVHSKISLVYISKVLVLTRQKEIIANKSHGLIYKFLLKYPFVDCKKPSSTLRDLDCLGKLIRTWKEMKSYCSMKISINIFDQNHRWKFWPLVQQKQSCYQVFYCTHDYAFIHKLNIILCQLGCFVLTEVELSWLNTNRKTFV